MVKMLENLAKTSFCQYPIERFSAINGIDCIQDIKNKDLDNDIIWRVLINQQEHSPGRIRLSTFALFFI